MQGAGGVGGLLSVRHGGQTYVPLMDGNGNVMGLQGLGGAKDSQTVARSDYDAFGNRITNTAPELGEEVNPFGFSTKFTDEATGLVYYGFRYYSPELGRWLSRDPIGERGGINLYGMVRNNPVNRIDVNGLWTWGGILGALLEGVGLEYEAAVFDDAWNDTIIDSYGGPEGFMDATERELAEKGQLPVDLFRKARAKNKAPINQGSEKALHDRLQAAMKNSKHYKDKRDFIIKRLKEGTAHQGFVNVDFQDAGENELGYSIGGGQLHYKYTDGPPPKVEFRVKDTYDFTKKGHVWGRLQDKGYLVIFDEDIFVEEVLCPKAK
jgi:RHS repeat-associated protein